MFRESTSWEDLQPGLLINAPADHPQANLLPSELGGDWREHIKNTYLEPLGVSDDSNEFGYSRFRLNGCWLCVYRVLRLPWTAIVLIAGAIALICFFIVFIVNGPSSRVSQSPVFVNGTQVVSGSDNLVTIQCETDVSKEECEKRARDRVAARDFQQAMTETHLFTTLIMFWLAATIFFVIKAVRIRKKFRHLESLPRSSIPVFSDLIPPSQQVSLDVGAGSPMNGGMNQPPGGTSGTGTTGQQQASLGLPHGQATTSGAQATTNSIVAPQGTTGLSSNNSAVLQDEITSFMVSKVPVHQQMKRSVSLRRYLQYYAEPSGSLKPADSNWGWRGEYAGVHFPSTIKLAVHDYLEARVVALDDSLKIRKDQTVRDWLMMLKAKVLPQEMALDALADFYERARFSDEGLDEATWYFRMHQAYEVSRRLEEVLMQRRVKVNRTQQQDTRATPITEPIKMHDLEPTTIFTPQPLDQSYVTAKQDDDGASAVNSLDDTTQLRLAPASADASGAAPLSPSFAGLGSSDLATMRSPEFNSEESGYNEVTSADDPPNRSKTEEMMHLDSPVSSVVNSGLLSGSKPPARMDQDLRGASPPKNVNSFRNSRAGSL